MQTISKYRRIHGPAQRTTRRGGSTKAAAPQRSIGQPAPDFLRHCFVPLYAGESQTLPDKELLEQQYFESLALLQIAYAFKPMDVSCKAFPYNLLLSAWDVEQKMKRIAPEMDLHIAGCRFLIDSGTRMDTRQRLYYIPIQPLFMLTKAKGRHGRKTAQLLLSVFAYLYDKAAIPCYTTYSFIGGFYELIGQWITDDFDRDEKEQYFTQLNEVRAVFGYGEIITKKLRNVSHLSTYKQRMEGYLPCNQWEQEILNMATDIYHLWQSYPDTDLYSHIIPLEPEDEEEQVTRIEQYISFVGTTDGALFHDLLQMVNDRFGESVDMDEPATFTIYGKDKKISVESFDYEQKLLPLLEDLIYLLNNRP